MTENQRDAPLIVMRRCAVLRKGEVALRGIDWTYRTGESWLIIGGNGSGTEHFVRALAGELEVAHGDGGGYENAFSGSVECVSLERAAALIEEERARDESDFTDGADAGRTCRRYLAETLAAGDSVDNDAARERLLAQMDTLPEVALFGIVRVLDRGLKYLSTGEIRRTLLCRALLSGKKLLVLAEPFAGLDAESRRAVRGFLDDTARRRAIVLAAERYDGVPDSVNRVLEFSRGEVSFCGSRGDYEAALRLRGGDSREASRAAFRRSVSALAAERLVQSGSVRQSQTLELLEEPQQRDETADGQETCVQQSQTADFAATRRLVAGFPEETRTVEARHSGESHESKDGESQDFGVQCTGNALCEPEAAPFAPARGVAVRRGESPHARAGSARIGESFSTELALQTRGADIKAGEGQSGGQTGASFADGDSRRGESTVPLVEMKRVNVGWDSKLVLADFNWRVLPHEHWFIRGPNGSGKTTLLELITGDNPQAFSNDVSLFGRRRGTGETLWDIRKRLGIVSHRLHVEYRMVGGTSLEDVLISGFHDSVGLYEARSDVERLAARQWLALAGFAERAGEPFSAFSYGEQRAALILRAAAKCPPLLILDEPCHALDEKGRRMVLDLAETIAEAGVSTVLHVSHDPLERLPCERQVLELRPGETPTYRVRRQPLSREFAKQTR